MVELVEEGSYGKDLGFKFIEEGVARVFVGLGKGFIKVWEGGGSEEGRT